MKALNKEEIFVDIMNSEELKTFEYMIQNYSKSQLAFECIKQYEIINNAIKYNNYLKEHCKYNLNTGHLRKMNKILRGGNTDE